MKDKIGRPEELVSSGHFFINWIENFYPNKSKWTGRKIDFLFSKDMGDWIFKVRDSKTHVAVQFNSSLFYTVGGVFFESIFLHELVHFYIHNLLDKKLVSDVKKQIGPIVMTELDIEADSLVALYLMSEKQKSLFQAIETVVLGIKHFRNSVFIREKFQRDFGSMLTVTSIYARPSANKIRLFTPGSTISEENELILNKVSKTDSLQWLAAAGRLEERNSNLNMLPRPVGDVVIKIVERGPPNRLSELKLNRSEYIFMQSLYINRDLPDNNLISELAAILVSKVATL
jgi:hypothetical protein